MTAPVSLLLVDDDADTRRSIGHYLRARGFAVDEAHSAGTALERLEARRPDLVLLDLGLPDRDGLTVIRRLRRGAPTPILVLSARRPGDREGDRPGGRRLTTT